MYRTVEQQQQKRNTMAKTANTVRLLKIPSVDTEPFATSLIQNSWVRGKEQKGSEYTRDDTLRLQCISRTCTLHCECWDLEKETT